MIKVRRLLFAGMLLIPASLQAGEPLEPVKVLMAMAEHNAGTEPAADAVYEEYFSANMLLRFFSRDFTETYAKALLRAAEKRDELLIDWDPIIGGQDSCPLKDIKYGTPNEKNGKTEIVVSFKARTCWSDDSGKDEATDVIFTLIKEDVAGETSYLVDDIGHRNDVPLKVTLADMAK